MELTEDAIIQKYGKHCGHCNRNTLLPYEHEFTCIACGYNVSKRKHELSKIQKNNFINRLKYAEVKFFSLCVDVYKIYEVNDFEKIYEVLSTLKYKKVRVNNTLIDIYKEMLLNHIFEQKKKFNNFNWLFKIAHNSFRIMKWICYCDRSYYENIKYYDLMVGICKYLNETSKR